MCSAHDLVTQVEYSLAAPPEQRGQVIGVAIAALRAAQGLAIVAAGALAQAFTPTTVVAIAAVAGTGCGAAAWLSWTRATRTTRPNDAADGVADGAADGVADGVVRPRRNPLDEATPPPAQ
jgi:hypothetical protein